MRWLSFGLFLLVELKRWAWTRSSSRRRAHKNLAQKSLDHVLADWRVSARRYLLHLELSRFSAKRYGTTAEVEALDEEIRQHVANDRLPQVCRLDYFFSAEGYEVYGPDLFDLWSAVLVHISLQSQRWDRKLASFSVKKPEVEDPYRLPGFSPTCRVWSSGWLEELRRAWRTELHDVYPQLGHCLP